MTNPQKTVRTANGDEFTIRPLTHGRLTAAVEGVRRLGIEPRADDPNLYANLKFAALLAREVIVGWTPAGGSPATPKERDAFVEENAKALQPLVNLAAEFQAEVEKGLAVESGN